MSVENIEVKLDRIIKLLATSAIRGSSQSENIAMLSVAGFQPKEIAELLDTTSGTVRVALAGMRKRKKSAKTKRGSK